MKVKIKSFKGQLPECITQDKEYQIGVFDGKGFDFVDDDGDWWYTKLINSWVLNGGDWEIVE
ncbi:MAG: hypothetical protein GAK29_01420 [Acinetobacter bereziniae]|uniref:Uncharacterized protein n=1 Tax=Acinetobacter bereziniae TaxID=106648 RepID=A0A833PDF3_ACIBZ|nr:MAG: hypothetical protein GAK29_01420 [Acinetobacter bereziniae]